MVLQPSTLSPAVTTGDGISSQVVGRGHHPSYWGIGRHIPGEAEPGIFKTGRRVVALQPAPCKAHIASYQLPCALVGAHPFQKARL